MPSKLEQQPGGVSVVIPVYNRFEFLGEVLRSVFAQTRVPDEVLLVDDCSSESLEDHLKREPSPGPVRILRTDHNRFVSGARNWGWRHAAGEFITFLDSDDLWEPDKTRLQLEYLEARPEIDGVYGAMIAFFPDNWTQPWAHDRPPRVDVASALIDANISVQSLMIRRKALETLGGFDERFRILDDQVIAIRMGETGLKIDFLASPPVTRLRRNAQNFSNHARRYFREEFRIAFENRRLSAETYGPGSWRVHVSRALKRFGQKVRFMGLPTRILSGAIAGTAPFSRMPRL